MSDDKSDPRELPIVDVTISLHEPFNATAKIYADGWVKGAERGAELLHALIRDGVEPDEALETVRAELAMLPPGGGPAWANTVLRSLDGLE